MNKQQPQQQRAPQKSSESPLSDGPPPKRARPIEFYPVPADLQDWDDGRKVAAIGLFKLTLEEESVALQLAGDVEEARGIECVKSALAELEMVGGGRQSLTIADGSADRALKEMPPQVRKMCGTAYVLMHMPREDQLASFLGGRRVVLR